MLKNTLLAVFALFIGQSVYATDLLIEPYLGYHSAKFSESGSKSPNATGLTYGARLGGDYMNFQFGLDYMSGAWTDDQNPEDNITPANFGVFLGFKFPAFLRVYGSYFFNEEYKFKNSSGSTNYTGTEFRFGLGFTMLPIVNINIEYGTGNLTEGNGNSLSQDVKVTYYGLVLSVPLEF